ncbi:MAG TPA: KUP/HAK/KT family potassium transporter [Gemmatimonadaceae bacterium]|nr:KUP/HAK/KT family potassium transporter [Gemmatimonadaceae bacterium]
MSHDPNASKQDTTHDTSRSADPAEEPAPSVVQPASGTEPEAVVKESPLAAAAGQSATQSTTGRATPSQERAIPAPRLAEHHAPAHPTGRRLALLGLTALGVVYGDIGTSPLYAMKESFSSVGGLSATIPHVYGVLSLIVWALTLVVSVKYIVFVLRADNRGEGGTLALLALIQQRVAERPERWRRGLLVGLGLFGTSLLFGEGIITPAISVLGAMEGLHVATPALQPYVVPLTVAILFALFMVQRRGTAGVGRVFGPVMMLWFSTIALFGIIEIAREPQILLAVNPLYAVRFFANNGTVGFFILGAVVLVITGTEALYADLGHFGTRPIRVAWFAIVFPALLLNYFGQGALLLRDASASANPFFLLVPKPLLYPMVLLAMMAAIVASQALISGAFSLARQAMQLGYLPRVTVLHTSASLSGQIYVPEVNALLMVSCIALVIAFGSVSALAAAYGIAVTGTMSITTLLFAVVARSRFKWPVWRSVLFVALFLTIDLSFFSANVVKIASGGWFPLAVAIIVYVMMSTWKEGRAVLYDILASGGMPLDLFLADVARRQPLRVPGTAVFMTSGPQSTPVVLLHHLKHNKVLHEQVVLLSVHTAEVPFLANEERLHVSALGQGFYRIDAHYGFMESPNVPDIMEQARATGLDARPMATTFYLGRERLIATGASPMHRWRKALFAFMSRNARGATQFFGIPPNRVVELGAQIEF